MRVSRDELAELQRRRRASPEAQLGASSPVREGWADGVLTVFVRGKPVNPLSRDQWSYMKHARLRKEWRERTAHRLLIGRATLVGADLPTWYITPTTPKKITFTVHGPSAFDSDNLAAVCKSVRDALTECRVIQDDRESAGHTFCYAQATPTRSAGAVHGIAIEVKLKED